MLSLRRITSAGAFIPQIDGLRFIAIFSVVLVHLHGSLAHDGALRSPFAQNGVFIQNIGKRGVELFFCISGFILSIPFARRYLHGAAKVNLKAYFLRRLTRLEPPYILNLLAWTIALVLAGKGTLPSLLPHLAASVAYMHNLIYGAESTINGVAWSLEVEIQFYLIVPFLTYIFAVPSDRLRHLLLLLTITSASIVTLGLATTRAQSTILYYAPFFLAGFVVADFYLLARDEWANKKSYLWDLVSLLGWPLVWIVDRTSEHLLLPLVFVLLFFAAFRGRITSRVLSYGLITDIGGMCYTIYLFHSLVIGVCGRLTKHIHIGNNFFVYYLLQACLILPCVLIVCSVYFLLIERPCMDRLWPQKLLKSLTSIAGRFQSPAEASD